MRPIRRRTRRVLPAAVGLLLLLAAGWNPVVAAGTAEAAPLIACTEAAASGSAAATMARRCERPVEDLSARSEWSRLFRNANGTASLEMSVEPQRVRRLDGGWVAADTGLVTLGDGSWRPRASMLDMRFSGGGSGPLVTVRKGASEFTLGWPAELPVPKVADDTVTYPDVLPGVDLALTATVNGFSHVLVVRDAAAAANPLLRRIGYSVGGTRVTVGDSKSGGVSVVGDDSQTMLDSGVAMMWDSAAAGLDEPSTFRGAGDGARRAPVTTKVSDGQMVLEPDPVLLAGAHFPLYIDPAFHGPTPSRWAYSNNTNENNDTATLRMGRNPTTGAVYRPLFAFPVGVLVGSRILSATFRIQLYHSWSCGATPATLWRANGIVSAPKNPWGNSGVNTYLDTRSAAANKDSCYTSAQPTIDFSGNLTGDVQAVANAGWGTYTLALSAMSSNGSGESTTDRWKKFNVGTAVLVVNYNHSPRQPALADMSIDPSAACTAGTTYVNTENGLTLRANLSDPNGDNVRAQWQVTGVPAAYLPPDSAPAAAGSFSTTIPAAAFTDATTYTWSVRGNDGTDAGAWSPSCAFRVDNTLPGIPTVASSDLAMTSGLLVPAPPPTAVVGRPAAVSITKPAPDNNIAGYLIGIGVGAQAMPSIWVPAATDGNAVAPVVPVASGTNVNYLSVQPRNLAGQSGATVVLKFRANAGTAPGARRDVTGDGFADIQLMYDAGNNRSALYNLDMKPDGSGAFGVTNPILTDPGAFPPATLQVAGDFNGDGREDVVKWRDEGGGCHISMSWWLSTGNGYLQSPVPLWNSGPGNWCLDRFKPVAGDFNADGKTDIAAFYNYDGGLTKLWMFLAKPDGSGLMPPTEWWNSGAGNWDFWRTVATAGDFNGDGRDEIAALYDYGSCTARLWVFNSTGSAFVGGGSPWLGQNNWCLADTRKLMAGDMDNDGKDEVIAVGCTCPAGSWAVYRWKGPNLDTFGQVGSNTGWSDMAQTKFVGGDFNGDGRFDIGHFYNLGGTWMSLWLLYSTGTGFGPETFVWDSSGQLGGMEWSRSTPL